MAFKQWWRRWFGEPESEWRELTFSEKCLAVFVLCLLAWGVVIGLVLASIKMIGALA